MRSRHEYFMNQRTRGTRGNSPWRIETSIILYDSYSMYIVYIMDHIYACLRPGRRSSSTRRRRRRTRSERATARARTWARARVRVHASDRVRVKVVITGHVLAMEMLPRMEGCNLMDNLALIAMCTEDPHRVRPGLGLDED